MDKVLETSEMKRKLNAFCDTSLEKGDKAFAEFADLLNKYQEQAFYAGFQTAVELLTNKQDERPYQRRRKIKITYIRNKGKK